MSTYLSAPQRPRFLRFFSTITRFGTPRDVTIDELRIECTFPADDATAEFYRATAAGMSHTERNCRAHK